MAHTTSRHAMAHDAAQRTRVKAIGTLMKFITYLVEKRVINDTSDVDTFVGGHMLQKYVYIAQRFGADLKYRFNFVENGAFSADMAIDLEDRDLAQGGVSPFEGKPHESDAFITLVSGKSLEWLEIATFALHELDEGTTRDGFADRMKYNHMKYDKRMFKDAFDQVSEYAIGNKREEP